MSDAKELINLGRTQSVPEREAIARMLYARHPIFHRENWHGEREQIYFDDLQKERKDSLLADADAILALFLPPDDKRAGEDWQLVETAPADVDVQLAWKALHSGEWAQKIGYARCTRGGWLDGQATHWKPLSAPPSTPAE